MPKPTFLALPDPEEEQGGEPTYVYSTQLVAAWVVNRMFYGDEHYCYVSARFNNIPYSSSPKGLLMRYLSDIRNNDKGGLARTEKLPTIQRVARKKLSRAQLAECLSVIEALSDVHECYPVLYVIDWKKVRGRAERQNWINKANPWSSEVLIPRIYRDEFTPLFFRPIIL